MSVRVASITASSSVFSFVLSHSALCSKSCSLYFQAQDFLEAETLLEEAGTLDKEVMLEAGSLDEEGTLDMFEQWGWSMVCRER